MKTSVKVVVAFISTPVAKKRNFLALVFSTVKHGGGSIVLIVMLGLLVASLVNALLVTGH